MPPLEDGLLAAEAAAADPSPRVPSSAARRKNRLGEGGGWKEDLCPAPAAGPNAPGAAGPPAPAAGPPAAGPIAPVGGPMEPGAAGPPAPAAPAPGAGDPAAGDEEEEEEEEEQAQQDEEVQEDQGEEDVEEEEEEEDPLRRLMRQKEERMQPPVAQQEEEGRDYWSSPTVSFTFSVERAPIRGGPEIERNEAKNCLKRVSRAQRKKGSSPRTSFSRLLQIKT